MRTNTLAEPEVITPEAQLQEWAQQVTHAYRKSVAGIIAVGQLLIEAKKAVGHGRFERLFRDHPDHVSPPVGFSSRTGRMLMAIAAHPVLSDRNHGSEMPLSWRTLYELSRHQADVVSRGIVEGVVRPDMERADAAGLDALLAGHDPDAPDSFQVFDETIEVENCCPRCGYVWSGKA